MRSRMLLSVLMLGLAALPAAAQPEFSLDAASPSVPGVGSADVLSAGGVGGPPLGLLHLSVDRAAHVLVSLPDPADSASHGQAAGDVYVSAVFGYGTLAYNPSDLGLVPALGADEEATGAVDDLDALHLVHGTPQLFSLSNGLGGGLGHRRPRSGL